MCSIVAKYVDECLKIHASIALEWMMKFGLGIIAVFGEEHWRKLNQANVDRRLEVAKAHDFLIIMGTTDCMH